MDNQVVVIDNGTGYTKMGYAGNNAPSHIIQTLLADHVEKSGVQVSRMENPELDFYIGDNCLDYRDTHNIIYPMSSGTVKDWEAMEKFWHRSLYYELKCDPENHYFVLTEPPMNPPENREQIAEIFFETFGVQGLYIGVQATLALYSNWFVAPSDSYQKKVGLTGTVLDSGDGVTHVIPVCDGFVIGSCIKHIPLAGRDITKFIMQMMKDRGEPIPQEDLRQVAKEVKEKYSYCAGDLLEEIKAVDTKIVEEGKTRLHSYSGKNSKTGEKYKADVGYEIFMGPEMFFKPEFVDAKWRTPIDEVIDNSIQACPIDTRRKLYTNVVLSGGSTTIRGFKERLQTQLQSRVDARFEKYKQMTNVSSTGINVNVTQNPFLKYSVWHGASMMASEAGFLKQCHTRKQYEEYGPSIARYNAVTNLGM